MAKQFVTDIQANEEVAATFVVGEKQLRVARNGNPFLTLKLVDKTGEIIGRVWERADQIAESIVPKGIVFVRGRSERFRDELQLQIQQIRPVSVAEVDRSDFLPVCPVSSDILLDKLKKIVSTVKGRSLHSLIKHILADRDLMERYRLAPAAKSMHHAYLGGLLEHSVSVAALVSQICKLYPELDRDLLTVGALLHDLGKIEEFVYDICIDYSHAGRLIGHMVLGLQIIDEKIRTLRAFPAEEAMVLKHLILSHHGQPDMGAVRLPMTREAFVLHLADDLDAKMNSISRILSETKGGDESWTAYQPLFERFFFRGLPPARESEAPSAPEPEEEEDKAVQLSIWKLDGAKNRS